MSRWPPRNGSLLLSASGAAASSFALSWLRGIAQLYARHPHEDAFILFRYAEHLAHGLGIVFNPGGPRAEGATDFLWMVLLAGLVRLGCDVAVSAIALNAAGSALIAAVQFGIVTRNAQGKPERLLGWTVALCVPFLAGAHAGYDGFSAQLNAGLTVLTYWLYLRGGAWLRAVPYMALLLGLFRPDGVIVGAGFCLIALLGEARQPAGVRRLLPHFTLCAVLGALYFIGRREYFGEWLPLPLYVKSRGAGSLPGFDANRAWLSSKSGPAPALALSAVLSFWLALDAPRRAATRRILAGTLPVWLLFAALAFGHQTQNVDYRFQAAIYTVTSAACLALATELATKARTAVRVPLLLGGVLVLVPALREGKKVWPLDYMDCFAVRMGRALRNETLALTEAGRMAYWTDAAVHDMIGLNDAHTAKHPPTVSYVRTLNPDVVLFHVAGTLDLARSRAVGGHSLADPVVEIDARSLISAVRPPFQPFIGSNASDYAANAPPSKLAPVVLAQFLATSPEYEVFAVRYGASLSHVFGVRRGQPYTHAVEEELERAQALPYFSYAQAKKLSGHGLSCKAAELAVRFLGIAALSLPRAPVCDPTS